MALVCLYDIATQLEPIYVFQVHFGTFLTTALETYVKVVLC